ncbi:MAG TPA: FHA domain-containing protein, partial [Polyangiaceae bacterium]|nr:FHA domain-containing protein [Polyangiaceae bacterium]
MPVTLAVLSKSSPGAPRSTSTPPSAGASERPERSITFDATRVVLGRAASADLVLPESSVSQRHASIRTSGAEYAVVDEGSTNGTFVGDVRLTPHVPRTLRSGDRLRLGRVWVEVRFNSAPATRDLALATRDLAMAMAADLLGGGDLAAARVEVHGGPDDGAAIALTEEGRAYVVGRGEGCDLLLADPDTSRQHVLFVRRGEQTFVVDLGSKNGSYLGPERLPAEREVRVASGQTVELGRTRLVHEEPAVRVLASLSAAPDDEVLDEEPPPPPPRSSAAPGAEAAAPPTTTPSDP